MLRIGFADYYLDNWHANYYPGFLREAIARHGVDAAVTHAFAIHDSPPDGGVTTQEWCRERDIVPAGSMEELVDSVDAVMVIAADNAAWHERVAELPLKSGRPVFSSSAQRYCQDILDWQAVHKERPRFVSTVGPHSLDSYAVHQLEPIVALMGTGVKRLKAFAVGSAVTQLILDYGDGRLASFVQSPQPYAEFNFMASDGENGARLKSDGRNFYHNLMKVILDFFVTGKVPVPHEETLEILAIIDTAREARRRPDTWLDIVI